MHEVNQGRLDVRSNIHRDDELGQLSTAFDTLLDEKVSQLSEAEKENDQLNESIVELLKSVAQLSKKDFTTRVPVFEDVTGAVGDSLNLLAKETGGAMSEVRSISMKVAKVSAQVRDQANMGILPCGGGASRMAQQVGLGRALEIILGARDFDADRAQEYGTINLALDANEIGPYVEELANRIAQFPSESIEACKRTVYASIELPIDEALKEEAYWLYQSMSKTPAQKRFQFADDNGAQNDMDNQRNWDQLVIGIQEVK